MVMSLEEISKTDSLEGKSDEEYVEIAEICIKHVIACNFAGYTKFLEGFIVEELARSQLKHNHISPCVGFRSCWALVIAKIILLDTVKEQKNLDFLVLKLTFFNLWTQALIERDSWILENAEKLIEQISEILENEKDLMKKTRIQLEMAAVHFMYYQYDKANKLISEASKNCNLNVNLTGMMGKRTRYQEKEVAQLVLVYQDANQNIGPIIESGNDTDIPIDCSLNDDTLLEQVAVAKNEQTVDGRRLTEIQLACLLWIARHEKATHCADTLVHERCMPFIETILSARRCWPVQSAALLLRADLEKSHGRRVDRSCSQTELVCKLMQGIDDEHGDDVRLSRTQFVISSGLEPIWQANVLHTGILRSLGCTAEALLILEKLELWDNVIECYKTLGQLEKAETLLRGLIVESPYNTMLYVYLGDITHNTEYYYKAIELSEDRNARAHRSLGHLLLMQKHFEQAYKHLRRSLELQPIQLGTWFNAGYCAWKLENFKDSAHCYHRCVSFQPDHFEAWNNLSAAYIRYGQKEKAWKLLQEALKFNYEHANVWENYMLLSVDVGSFSQAITAYHRLLDLNKRGADDEVLELIATQVLKREKENLKNEELAENAKDKADLVKLLARITAQHQTLSPKTLHVYAQLKKPEILNEETRTEYEKYVQLMEKSFGLANGKQNWSKDEEASINVLETAIQLAQDRLELARFINSPTSVKEASSRIRLSIRGVITRVEKDESSRTSGESQQTLHDLLTHAKTILESVTL